MKQPLDFKLVIFDLDGTLTKERSIWEYIHKRLGKWYGLAERYQQQFLSGEISYERFCELDAMVWKGMKVEELLNIVKTVPFYPGVNELIGYLKEKHLKISIISSGLSLLSDFVSKKYGFDYSISNDLLYENGTLTGKVDIKVYYDRKAEWVDRICNKFGITPGQTIAIGDSHGDIEMFKKAGFSIAFNPSCPELEKIATVCINSDNLSDIIFRLPF